MIRANDRSGLSSPTIGTERQSMQRANFKQISKGERSSPVKSPAEPTRMGLIGILDPTTWPKSGTAYWEARRDEYLKERSKALAQPK